MFEKLLESLIKKNLRLNVIESDYGIEVSITYSGDVLDTIVIPQSEGQVTYEEDGEEDY